MTPAQLIEARRICALSWWTLTGDHTHQALALLRAALPLLEALERYGTVVRADPPPPAAEVWKARCEIAALAGQIVGAENLDDTAENG